MRVDARQCEVDVEHRGVLACRLRGKLFENKGDYKNPVAVGDWVRIHVDGDENAVEAVLPRSNHLSRRAAGDPVLEQVLVSNVDQVVVTASFGTPPFSSITTDRILVCANRQEVPGVLILNKIDRAKAKKVDAVAATYEAVGVRVLRTSAKRDEGIELLAEALRDKVSVLAGLSGAGKSSLLNCIEPGLGLRTREVSKSLRSGRHTTSFSCMYPLAGGGYVVDTPGIRTWRPFGCPPSELRLHFPEMLELGRECNLPACTHRHEPDCAVIAQVESGEVAASRYRSYLEILEELEQVYGTAG